MRRRWILLLLLVALGFTMLSRVSGHAALIRSEPPANAMLAAPPELIRLWFSEAVEPEFSSAGLRDAAGQVVEVPPAESDADDPTLMSVRPGMLPDGLYTVVWSAVSAVDGHVTRGSFSFAIGAAPGEQVAFGDGSEMTAVHDVLIRWLNLLGLALAVGSIAFFMFVWNPTFPDGEPEIEHRMSALIWIGWLVLGVAGGLVPLMQTALAAGISLGEAVTHPALGQVIGGTRFGMLWLARLALWLCLGCVLWLRARRQDRRLYWPALAFGVAILLAASLYSHAGGASDSTAALANNWLHLLMAALWFGGLAQFVNVIGPVRRKFSPAAPLIGRMVGHFSNFARLAVAGLVVTGFYAAWLHVSSVEALFTTSYGHALLLKLLLIVPLLGIAGVNLVITHRRLQAREEIWSGRLRHLVSAELVLLVGVLAAVGAMTSMQPSRITLALRTAAAAPLPQRPFAEEQMTEEHLHILLRITPGWVGENTFEVLLAELDGNLITDASLIRMRFEHTTENLGESELRPQHDGKGVYAANGANLSVPGEWRIRVTIQRPGRYDDVFTFRPVVKRAPPPLPVNVDLPVAARSFALLVAGLGVLSLGGFALSQSSAAVMRALALSFVLVGMIFLMSAFYLFAQP